MIFNWAPGHTQSPGTRQHRADERARADTAESHSQMAAPGLQWLLNIVCSSYLNITVTGGIEDFMDQEREEPTLDFGLKFKLDTVHKEVHRHRLVI